MFQVDRFRVEDRSTLGALFQRIFGDQAAEALRRRWEWQYCRNPHAPDGVPIWVAREDGTPVGQFATIPVVIGVYGAEMRGAWGADLMIAPERQSFGLSWQLVQAWDRNTGASIGIGATPASTAMFKFFRWPFVGALPQFAKPLSRRVLTAWNEPDSPLGGVRRFSSRFRPLGGDVRPVGRFDEGSTRLWERTSASFGFAARRDAAYLNWRFVDAPHVQYSRAALVRDGEIAGYVVYRHIQEPRWRVTVLVDFLADPSDATALDVLLRWVEREALAYGSETIRAFSTNARFNETLGAAGFRFRRATVVLVVKINAVSVSADFYQSPDAWHVTIGDSDADY